MKNFGGLRMSKFWSGVQPEVNTNFSSAGKTLENLTAELLGPNTPDLNLSLVSHTLCCWETLLRQKILARFHYRSIVS